jgi:8-oxo-dGTP diphosphatase
MSNMDVVGKKTIRVVAAVVEREGHYLITQRRDNAVLANLWEFPGGKVEAGEEDEDALKRELRERLDAEAKIGKKLGEKIHEYDGYRVALALYEATLIEGRPLHAKRVKEFRWVGSADFDKYPFPDADQQTMDQLLGFSRS